MGTLSVEEYFVLDDVGEVNSEYHDGEMFPIEDLNVWHGIIGANTAWRLLTYDYGEIAEGIAARPNPTWRDACELAEIASRWSGRKDIRAC